MEPSSFHSRSTATGKSALLHAMLPSLASALADTKRNAPPPRIARALDDVPPLMRPPPSLAQVRAQFEPVTAISRELSLSPLQASLLREGVSAEEFVKHHQQILKRMGVGPASEQGASAPAGESFNPVGVFGFYDMLTRRLPQMTPSLPDGGLNLRQAVARERQALADLPRGGAVDAIRSLLERLERALREADAAWAANAARPDDVVTMILHIAKSQLPVADKARRLLAFATAQPQVLTHPGVFTSVHEAMLQAFRQDPIWATGAPESGRASAPDPGAVFRFYARLRTVAETHPPLQAGRDPWGMELCQAIANVDADKSLRHQVALRAQLCVPLQRVIPLRDAQIQAGTTLAMQSGALAVNPLAPTQAN